MKSEQRKKEDREFIERLLNKSHMTLHDAGSGYKEFILNTDRINDFIKSENLEPKLKLELNRWIVDSNSPEWMIYLDGEDRKFYGVNCNGDWMSKESDSISNASLLKSYNKRSKCRHATDEEIFERLSKIAVKMGYKERQSECLSYPEAPEYINLSDSFFVLSKDDSLWIANDRPLEINCIFKDGKWAKFIETDTERIERLEKRVKELENKNK